VQHGYHKKSAAQVLQEECSTGITRSNEECGTGITRSYEECSTGISQEVMKSAAQVWNRMTGRGMAVLCIAAKT